MDGSVAPYTLPLLPGPEKPTNSVRGKWKIVIHTVGLRFLAGAKVYVDGQYTGEYFKEWMARALQEGGGRTGLAISYLALTPSRSPTPGGRVRRS